MVELKGDNSRLQSSLGSELINDNMSNAVGKLSLARVTDINYQKNTATFIRFLSTGGTDVSGATSEALLPMPSAGRNGFGNAYGEVLPIHPGDIVLVGYVGDRLDKPIILARYGDASIAQEISGQQSPHYEVNDFSAYGKANQSMVVYPSQEYDLMDGKGNRSIKLAGNTFVLVRNDIPQASRGTDDGVQPVASSDIPGNVDGNGKSRNSLVQNAPEIIFGHRGNITASGDKDNHATYVRIGDDGNFRLSQMQDNQDWRTYFEMTPDGKIRLRRQEDAKIFNTGLKSSEISIDNNGYVTLRSQSTGLVLRPDGIYNLDGTKFTPGGDTDLSKVWESIQETKDGLQENKTQIEINSKEIATKVSTDILPDAINDQLKPYSESLDALKDSYADVQKAIDNLASDGVISGADKKATRTIWLQIQTEYPATIAQAEANGVDHSSLDAAYTALKSYLEPILSASGDTNVDPTEWDRNFSNYYNASYNVNTAIVSVLRKLAQDGYDKAVQAGKDAGSAITQASEASSEDYLTSSDKAMLNHVWVQIQNQYPNDVASANAVSIDHSALDSAYNDLSSYITSNNVFADSSTIAIDGSALADKIKAYFSQEATVLKQVADKNIQTLAQYGEDINHQATSIKETRDKIALSAENIQKHGDSLAVMQGQLGVMANQISGGVSETDVTGIVNDSLSGTDLGSTNQFILITATKGQYLNGNNGTSYSSANGIITDYISVNAGSNYTAKVYGATGTTKLSVTWYDTNKNFISGTEVSGTGNFTNAGASPSNSAYSRVSTDNYNVNTLFMAGNAPDAWVPSYEDAKIDANDANEFLKSLTDLQASLASLINANGNKKTYNIANIDSMFASGNIGSNDIGILKAVLSDITQDNASDNSLATQYSVDISALNDYFNQLKTDINGMLSHDEGAPVDIDSYKAKLSGYYTSRDTFLKAVKGKVDTHVADAKSALDAAKNTVQKVITNKYANFAVTVDGISTKVSNVSEKTDNLQKTTTKKFSELDQTADSFHQTLTTVTTTANNASEAAITAQSSAIDAKNRAISAASAAATAQASATTANSAASAAASAASAAQSSANTTQSSLDSLTDDGNISPIEKQTLAKEYATIKSNKTVDLAQASKYAVNATAYTNAESAVETLVDPILADMTTNTTIDRDKYKSTFSTYYTARTSLLNAIADVAKNAASAAASAASVAQGTANSAVSAASAAQSSATDAKNRAISAASAAATAQASATTANSAASAAASAASAAQSSANTAQSSANAAQTSLDALTNDGNISPIEKQTLAKEYTTIRSNKAVDLSQASKYAVDTTAYTNTESAVETLVHPILSDMTTNTAVDRNSYKSTFAAYYTARTNLLNSIADVAKNAASAAASAASVAQGTANSAASVASAAQSDLNDFKTTTTKTFSDINNTSDKLQQSVTAVTTQVQNSAVGTNLLLNSGNGWVGDYSQSPRLPDSAIAVQGTIATDSDRIMKITAPSSGEFFYRFSNPSTSNKLYGLKAGQAYTISGLANLTDGQLEFRAQMVKGGGGWTDFTGGISGDLGVTNSDSTTFTKFSYSFTIPSSATGIYISLQAYAFTGGTSILRFKQTKLELGSHATDWCPNPADNASASDLATTNQTVKTVRTQTANNWSIFAQGIGGTSAGISVDGNGTVTISGNKLVIGSDFIAGNITGKTIIGSDFINNYSHVKIDNPNIFRLNQIINSSTDLVVGNPNGHAYTIIPTQLSDMYGNYTFSAQVINANAGQTSVTIGRCDPSNGNNSDEVSDVPIVNGYVTKTFTGLSNPNYTAILVYPNSGAWAGSNGKVITYHHYKLQYGTNATAWIDPGSENIGYVSGNTEISSGFVQASGYVEDTNRNYTGIAYWTNLTPNGFENYLRMPDGQGSLSSTAIKNGIITLTQNVGDPMAPLKYKKYVQSDFRAQDNVTFYWNNTTAYTSGDVSQCYIYYSRRGSLVSVGFTLTARAAQGWLPIAHIRPGYMPYQVDSAGSYLGSMSYAGTGCKLYASAGLWLLIPQLGKGSYSGSTTYLTRDDYPLDDAYF